MSDLFCTHLAEGNRCYNLARINGLCARHSPRDNCHYFSAEGVQCSLLASRNGLCRHHAPEVRRICIYSNEGTRCSNLTRGNNRLCRHHGYGFCIHIEEGVQCRNLAVRDGLCRRHDQNQI